MPTLHSAIIMESIQWAHHGLRSARKVLGLSPDWHVLILATFCGIFMGVIALGFIGSMNWLLDQVAGFASGGPTQLWIAVALPLLGACITVVAFKVFPSSFHGHGVSRVMMAVHRQKSVLPLSLVPRQWIGSTATITSGGSSGPEGPIVAIGGAMGSCFASWLKLDAARRTTLLGCGAAAGMAAVFNAPLAGAFFVLEVILRDFTARTLTPIVIAAVTAAATAQSILHSQTPIFGVSLGQFDSAPLFLADAPQYAILGVIVGVAAAGFARLMKSAHQVFHRLPVPWIFKPVIGALLLVACGAIWTGLGSGDSTKTVPAFYGTGYQLIERLIQAPSGPQDGALLLFGSLALLGAAKCLATALTLGSGGAGGLFAPGLALGAILGAAFSALTMVVPWLPDLSPVHGVLVGMGAFVAAGAHAPLAGAFLVYELTHSYAILMPLLIAAVIATVAARLITRESIYSAELSAMNIRLTTIVDHAIMRSTLVRDVVLLRAVPVVVGVSAEQLVELGEREAVHDFAVVDDAGRYRAFVCGSDVRSALVYREALRLLTVAELERTDFAPLELDDTLDTALERFARHETQSLPVIDRATHKPVGLISRSQIMAVYNSAGESQ
ncbi:MAG: CBS domain-containing protein [Phycisphaerales bacterium]|nr:CBS domain-containing protein [Phycisphaerales bacterium]